MENFRVFGLEECRGDDVTSPSARRSDIYVQLGISAGLGLASFLGFCVSHLLSHLPHISQKAS